MIRNFPLKSPSTWFSPFAAIWAVALMAALGCIKREEAIAVLPDGSTFLASLIEGDPSDFQDGDALPTEQSGWKTEERVKSDSEEKKTLIRMAQRMVPPHAAIPDSYAAQNDPITDICLRFPTTITVERRPDGDYYHFRRVYKGRRYSQFIFWQNSIFESEQIQKITDKSPEQITDDERIKLAQAFILADTRKTAEFIEDAALAMPDRLPQDVWLAARQKALANYESEFTEQRLIELLKSEDGPQEALKLADQLRESAVTSMRDALREKNIAPTLIDAFFDAYQGSRHEFEITEDLGDESWRVTVTLPGTVIGNNGLAESPPGKNDDYGRNPMTHAVDVVLNDAKFEPGFTRVRWDFDGNWLADRDVVLAATSFVPRSK